MVLTVAQKRKLKTSSTLEASQTKAIADWLKTHNLSKGIGTKEMACSISSINLALTNTLTDRIPECMSEVIGNWIIQIQDSMPSEMRNSKEWKTLLPLAAGTGREKEKERLAIILSWMWETVLPSFQLLAAKKGFGPVWSTMITEKTKAAADAADAADAAYAAAYAAVAAANAAVAAADAATYAAFAAAYAANAATNAANAADYANANSLSVDFVELANQAMKY